MKKRVGAPWQDEFPGILDRIPGAAVLVVGDVMLDRFVYGRVERISPESPVPVLAINREDAMPGGAGNALANLVGLGAKPLILSVIGDDADGKTLRQKIQDLGCDPAGLFVDPARPTIVKTRYLAGHQQLLRTDYESGAPVAQKTAAAFLQAAQRLLKTVRVLLISDYGKGLLTRDMTAALIKMAKEAGVIVAADPKGKDFSLYAGADVITPNRKELSGGSGGMATETDAEIIAAAHKIMTSCKIGAVVATRSRDGMSVIQKDKQPLHLPGADIEVFDVSGAGDTVIAVVAVSLAAGADLESAAGLANIAGSIVVQKVGTAPVRLNEVRAALEEDGGPFAYADKKAPLATTEEAMEQVKRWRARGRKIGFTNGCFDILHAGHVSYLNAARWQCDRLVVGLNRDSSVRILKGSDRPVHDERSRAAVLAALACVDMVVLFGAEKDGQDNTASDLIKSLRPDTYFKGGDYRESEIPEAPAVRAAGGIIKLMPNFEGHSTTQSIKKIQAA